MRLRSLFIALALVMMPFREGRSATPVEMLMPGFVVEELPIKLSNQNNLRFAPDGTLTSLGYDGRIWRLRDTNGDGLEDRAEPFWTNTTLSVPLGMAWSNRGLYVSSKGKISLLRDTDQDGRADVEEILASGWPVTDVGSGGVDATAVTLDAEGNAYFGLLVADYSNAYRLRKRKELKAEEIEWLKQNRRWSEPAGANSENDEFSLYDLNSRRGTIQKLDRATKQLSTVATGIRVPVALAFNRFGDLFNTDQEGETWMPDGNPFDELNHIKAGRNYGFPPAHDRWLPGVVTEPPIVSFGPQHQSACGLVFNEPQAPHKGLFGPKEWEGNALVAGESRGKIWRVELRKTSSGYIGTVQTIARLSLLTLDLAISSRGDLYVACHSGEPDWGTGPQGEGKIFRIRYTDPEAPLPLRAWPSSPTEVSIAFAKPLHPDVTNLVLNTNTLIEFGSYVSAGDRFELLKPPYAVVQQQDAAPRGRLAIRGAWLDESATRLVLQTDPHPLAVRYALTLAGIRSPNNSNSFRTYLDYDLTFGSQPLPKESSSLSRESLARFVSWAPTARATGDTDSRAIEKPRGDWEHGRELFFGELQCAKCHRVRGEGGTAGPDLSNLIHRDVTSVLRDIREPGATIHPDYVTYRVLRRDQESVEGFIRQQAENSIHLFDAEGKETVIARSNVESVHATPLSLMPAGLLEGRKEAEINDLLTFLMWEPPKRSVEWRKPVPPSKRIRDSSRPDLHLVLVASKQDHGSGQHDYPNWQTNWARRLSVHGKIESAWEWPSAGQFQSATALIFYFWNHQWSPERLAQIDTFLARGGGIALIHSAVIADNEPEVLAKRIGLSAQPGRTGYRHMPFDLIVHDQAHAITGGLPKVIDLIDEPYWPLIGNPSDVTVLASASIDGQIHPLIWVKQQKKGRIFASVPGHYTWTLEDSLFQTLLLRGIAWVAGIDEMRFE